MNLLSLIITALALSMDAFAVSLASGLANKASAKQNSIKCATAFGTFQAGMTALGWLVGFSFCRFIQPFDHWIAFILLIIIGAKMIYDSRKITEVAPLIKFQMLLALALVTSMDALAAGLSFSSLGIQILLPSLLIGGVTFTLSFIGVRLGAVLSNVEKLEKCADVLGGIVLIAIGFNILIKHLMAGI